MKSRTAKFAGKSVTLYMYDMEGEKNPNLLVQVRMASFLKKKKKCTTLKILKLTQEHPQGKANSRNKYSLSYS